MNIIVLTFLFLFFCILFFSIRRSNRRDSSTNRYRQYQAKTAAKEAKMQPNRYYASQSKPNTIEKKINSIETNKIEIKKIKETQSKIIEMTPAIKLPEDSDSILGLKEFSSSIETEATSEEQEAQAAIEIEPPPIVIFHIMAKNPDVF